MKIYFTGHFVLPLPQGHRFPIAKYALLRKRVCRSGLVPLHELCAPDAASDGAGNYPFRKEPGDLDIALEDGAGDDEFLAAVGQGVDAALAERDRIINARFREAGTPVVLVAGGGHAERVEDTVDIHFASVAAAAAHERRGEPEATSR